MPLTCLSRIAAIVLAVATGLSPAAAEPGESFLDQFDRIDSSRWLISDGWTNGDWMNCVWSRDAVSARNGLLNLAFEAATNAARPYRCGEVQSRAVYGYGTFEIMFRTGRGDGLNAAFFTYIGPTHKQPHHEIDVEVLLRDPGRVSFNTYVDAVPLNGGTVALARPADAEFVHFAFTWRPDGIIWYVNGKERQRTSPGVPLPSVPQKIFASLWGSGTFDDWMGKFDPAAVPQTMQIDWIAYTRLGEDCQFPASILCDGS